MFTFSWRTVVSWMVDISGLTQAASQMSFKIDWAVFLLCCTTGGSLSSTSLHLHLSEHQYIFSLIESCITYICWILRLHSTQVTLVKNVHVKPKLCHLIYCVLLIFHLFLSSQCFWAFECFGGVGWWSEEWEFLKFYIARKKYNWNTSLKIPIKWIVFPCALGLMMKCDIYYTPAPC